MLKVLIILIVLPPILQLFWGLKALKGKKPFKFWQLSLLTFTGMIGICATNLYLMADKLEKIHSHDGLPFFALKVIELFFLSVLAFIIAAQYLVFYLKRRKQVTQS